MTLIKKCFLLSLITVFIGCSSTNKVIKPKERSILNAYEEMINIISLTERFYYKKISSRDMISIMIKGILLHYKSDLPEEDNKKITINS